MRSVLDLNVLAYMIIKSVLSVIFRRKLKKKRFSSVTKKYHPKSIK